MVFLLAGYETTSTALGLTAYILATHPEIQRKLQTEIDDHFPAHVGTQLLSYNYVLCHIKSWLNQFLENKRGGALDT